MTTKELRKLIHEEVVTAMREEFREILLEAVQKTEGQPLEETYQRPRQHRISERSVLTVQKEGSSISDLLQETARGMSREDYREFGGTGREEVGKFPDIIQSVVSRAKSVLDASIEKDQERHGI